MTDPQPAKATPAKAATAKARAAKATPAKTPAAKSPAVKTPVAKATPATPAAAKAPAAKTPASKAPAAKTPAAKAPATKAPATKASTTKAPAAKAPTKAPAAVAPVVPVVAAPAAAAAPAGWYPVAGSTQQRWWDGSAWTQHTYDAPTSAAPANHVAQKAPEGTSPTTIWFWLTAVSPIISIASLIPLGIFFQEFADSRITASSTLALESSPPYLVYWVLSIVEIAAFILFPILDWLALRKRQVPSPFHWAWSLAALVLNSPIVYVIGRTVVAKRRTGKGLAPLWVFIAVQVIAFIVGLVVIIVFIASVATQFGNLLSDAGGVL